MTGIVLLTIFACLLALLVLVGIAIEISDKKKALNLILLKWMEGTNPPPTKNELYLTVNQYITTDREYFDRLYAVIRLTWDRSGKYSESQEEEVEEPVRLE